MELVVFPSLEVGVLWACRFESDLAYHIGDKMSEAFKRQLARHARFDLRWYYFYMKKDFPRFSWESDEDFEKAKEYALKAMKYDKSRN